MTAAGPDIATEIGTPDRDRLRALLEELERIERPSASPGELEAAEWLVARFAELGLEARIETEPAHGTYWWPLGIGAAAGALAGFLALKGRRLLATVLGGVTAWLMSDEFPPGSRRLRSVLPRRETYNVVCELGDPEAERTVVLVAHHDAAHAGLVFHPAIPKVAGKVGFIDRTDTSPMLMAPVVGGPVMAALAGLTGRRLPAGVAVALGLGSAAAMADIGSRRAVPGANDNGTAVVSLIALAERLRDRPPDGLRVILLSTGSEESFSEGIKAFGERHFPSLPRESTFFVSIDTVGSPFLNVLRGEGFLRMNEYPEEALALVDGLAEELGIWLYPNLRLHNGTDGLEPLSAGYQTISLCSVNELKNPANYHWPNDVSENVDFSTVSDAIRLIEAVIRRLDQRWV